MNRMSDDTPEKMEGYCFDWGQRSDHVFTKKHPNMHSQNKMTDFTYLAVNGLKDVSPSKVDIPGAQKSSQARE